MSVPSTGSDAVDADVQSAFAATLVDEWIHCGVTRAVVCPGSRSTPLAVALATNPDMTVTVRLDERSAGFTALGMGMASGHPALVVTTSGTAAAELHPAVVEAGLAGIPLIACTADRPPELHDVGAPQTIDQTHLFGRSTRWFHDPGVPTLAWRAQWRSLAGRAVHEASTGSAGPGPVHLNLPFREPLLGDPDQGGGVAEGRPGGGRWHDVWVGENRLPERGARSLVGSGGLRPEHRGLIVAGAGCGRPSAVLALSDALGWPLLADPRSGLREERATVIAAADGILRSGSFSRDHQPEVILRLGERWVSKTVNQFLSSAAVNGARVVMADPWGRWPDPEQEAEVILRSDPSQLCADLVEALGELAAAGGRSEVDHRWKNEWEEAEARAQSAIDRSLGMGPGQAAAGSSLTEPALARLLMANLRDEATLMVSSSMPIRDVEAFARPRRHPVRTLANRGANGIDGVVSTALGVALATAGPTVALVGDLAFLHDVSALVRSPGCSPALTVVVADNAGGGIFSFLAPAAALDAGSFDMLFGTPQAADVADVASGFGWPVDDVGDDPHQFVQALERRTNTGGVSVIRVRLPGRTENVAHHDRINGAIVSAVETGRQ